MKAWRSADRWSTERILTLLFKMVFGTIAAAATACVNAGVGVVSYIAGFAPIATNTIPSMAMSIAWKTGVGIPVISYLQSTAATVANVIALL